ncbi:MAG TPA: LytTR family DNA-binding domain-containing protein [Candidatus Blautia faecavium]|uniref:Stage 0 sporulation protein A homolog n=1 Tax=Candidatus Blautia faecavium TaxID=2838487 RepID=A0A9D2LS60_9FIRM|nr:LytTR family DNA-binding domain-containing protein [Candidatus Blautia faecavium]
MIRIGVVDDEKMFRDRISEIVVNVLKGEQVQTEIKKYADGTHFFEALSAGETFDILLADIQMAGMDGMELGRRIRRNSPGMYIIFITSYEEYAAESYRIEAFQYILKQDLESRLPGVIRELAYRLEEQEQEYRIVGNSVEKVKLFYKNIIYLYKSKGAKYVNYVTEEGIFRERISLESLLKELDSKIFIPVERGYVVNMKRICRISGDTLYLEKGYQVQVSRARLTMVKQEITRCWGGK